MLALRLRGDRALRVHPRRLVEPQTPFTLHPPRWAWLRPGSRFKKALMFHVKRKNVLAIGVLLLFATMLVGCSNARSSRGWAAPVKTDSYLLISAGKGRLDGLDPTTREEKWRFPKSWQLDDSNARDLTGIYGDPIAAKDGTVYLG